MLQRVLVIGVAKTGTTVISKTIQNTLGIKKYILEPKRAADFELLAETSEDAVVKILFDHWADRPRLLNAVVHDEFRTGFSPVFFIVRDPRAEFVSRVHYVAFPYFSKQQGNGAASEAKTWISLFRKMEEDRNFTILNVVDSLRENFGVDLKADIRRAHSRRMFEYMKILPKQRYAVVRYEEFVGGTVSDQSYADYFSGSRNVGSQLERTRRTGGIDDWQHYFAASDLDWLESQFGAVCAELGYGPARNSDQPIDPRQSSEYVSKLINQALS